MHSKANYRKRAIIGQWTPIFLSEKFCLIISRFRLVSLERVLLHPEFKIRGKYLCFSENDHTECVLKDGGIIKLIMGKSSASERVADVAGLNKGSSAGHLQHTFYAIYCDSTLKAWNADVS